MLPSVDGTSQHDNTVEKRAQIIDALNANPNSAAVAKQIGGVSQATVWRIAKAAGIELTAGKTAGRRSIPAEKRAQIIDALKSNPNARQVARQIGGVSHVTVWKIAKAAGIELTARRRRASRAD
jgi:tripartite-type tricarboxylate transporter receptor subunit TctC